ncbi:CBN-WVE-1 protein [Caenorhabditis brenneri]|uniref:Wiskott-Aldrich syndrome protein family member n=1 Tax=Caenorhabditis brenneri TaxID=135651 RepID=G0NVQ1_CAEBE|nr:CBN-WVE-1 protein [Caenorhabditis brenneri]
MPLTKRAVSPVNVSRGTIPPTITRDELQCNANGTIANLIRQLSSISKHAENIFGEIYHDAMVIHHKTNTLQQRIDRLHSKVEKLDATTDQASLNEANMRKAFKSSMLVDQHILDRSTLPVALAERYMMCDQPPNLDALNPYRDSPTPALALYTNPSFFFDLWKKETLKDVAERPRRVKSPNDGSKSPKKRRKQLAQGAPTMYNDMQHRNRQISGSRINQQNEVFSFPEEYQAPQALGLQLNFRNQQNHHPANLNIVAPIGMTMHHHPQQNVHPNQRPQPPPNRGSPVIRRPTEAPPTAVNNLDLLPPPDMSILSIDDDDDDLPPPPPPLLMHTSIVHQLPTEVPSTIQFVEPSAAPPTNIPPPPPPPPPPPMSMAAATFAAPAPKPPTDGESSSAAPPPPKQPDARTDLLAQIQSGIKLKKVQRAEEEAADKAALEANNVAAILKRRMDQVMGNDDSSSEERADDDEWDD